MPRHARAGRLQVIPCRRALTAVSAVVLTGLVVVQGSQAAFSGSTSNDGNTFGAATVSVTDDDAGTALFNAVGMTPGSPVAKCITVTYTGTTTAVALGLHAAVTGGDGLDAYLDLTVERGAGGGAGDCTGFVAAGPVYTGTLAGFVTAHGTFPNRFSSWTPTATPESATYRITAQVQNDNAAQGKTTSATFTWEAQST